MAAQLVNLDTPERLLILPEAAGPGATWFDPAADLATTRAAPAALVLAACPANTPVTVPGYGHGALAACDWLAHDPLPYDRLLLYAAIFPASLDRAALLAQLPPRPVEVIATTADTYTPEAQGDGLLLDLRAAGKATRLRYVDDGPLTLAALGAGAEPDGLRTR